MAVKANPGGGGPGETRNNSAPKHFSSSHKYLNLQGRLIKRVEEGNAEIGRRVGKYVQVPDSGHASGTTGCSTKVVNVRSGRESLASKSIDDGEDIQFVRSQPPLRVSCSVVLRRARVAVWPRVC